MSEGAERVRRHRARKTRAEQLATYGFVEGERPSETVRAQVRNAVERGLLNVPGDGFDDGTRWRWFPAEQKNVVRTLPSTIRPDDDWEPRPPGSGCAICGRLRGNVHAENCYLGGTVTAA